MIRLAGRPLGSTFGKLFVAQFYVKSANDGVDLDDVAVLQQSDRSAHRCLRADMADAAAAGCAGEAAIGDQCDLAAHALTGQCCSGLQHFAPPGTAARPLVADDDDFAFLVGALLDRLEGVLLAVEAAGRPSET